MLQARDAVERRSWSHPQEPTTDEWWADVLADPRARKRERRTDLAVTHPQEPTTDEWWADVLADPRARKRERRTDLAVKQAFYRLADEKRETILVACSKCDWRAAFSATT